MKKLLSLCLSIVMACALVPAPALAEMADELYGKQAQGEVTIREEPASDDGLASPDAVELGEDVPNEASKEGVAQEDPVPEQPDLEKSALEEAAPVEEPPSEELYATDQSQDDPALLEVEANEPIGMGSRITYDDRKAGLQYQFDVTSYNGPDTPGATAQGGTMELVGVLPSRGTYVYGTDGKIKKDKEGNPVIDESTALGSLAVSLPKAITNDYGTFTLTAMGRRMVNGWNDCIGKLTIPNTVTELARRDAYDGLGGSKYLREVVFEKGSTITTIPQAFFMETGLRSIELPDSVQTIADHAFAKCWDLTSVKFPANLKTIQEYAFYCTDFASIDFPKSLEYIGDYAFARAEPFWTVGSDDPWEMENDSEVMSLTSLVIPDKVTYVGKAAFAYFNGTFHGAMIRQYSLDHTKRENYKGMTNIESLTLGKSLQTIGDFAFSGSKIKKLKLPASLKTIGTDAFSLSWYLTDVTFTDLEHAQLQELGGFQQCYALKHVDVPATVTTIGEAAFSECAKLTNITLPPSLKSVGLQAFSGAGIGDVDGAFSLPEGMETIGRFSFAGCENIHNVIIPSTMTYIGDNAFGNEYSPSGISSLTITPGSTPLAIGPGAFCGCEGLNGSTIILPDRVEELYDSSFLYLDDVTYKIYNDAIRINMNEEQGGGGGMAAYLRKEDIGRYFRDDLTTQELEDGSTLYYFSMSDPWGSNDYDTRKKIVPGPGSARVYYPSTLTQQTSPSFWTYLKCIEYQHRNVGSSTGYGIWWGYVWPEFEAFDVDTDSENPGSGEVAGAGRLRVTTQGVAGADANVCVFDANGRLSANAKANEGFALLTDLAPGTYTVVAFAANKYLSAIASEADLTDAGFKYAKKKSVAIRDNEDAEVTLNVPAIGEPSGTARVVSASVTVPRWDVVKNVEFFATVKFKMDANQKASALVVSVPNGLEVTSISSANKSYGKGVYNASTKRVTVSLDAKDAVSGQLYVGLKPTAMGTYSIDASVVAGGQTLPVGSATLTCEGVRIEVPSAPVQVESNTAFPVTVYAEPGSMVTIDTPKKSFELGPTNRAGNYTGTLELGDYAVHGISTLTVRASVEDGGKTYTDVGSVRLLQDEEDDSPVLTEFSFVHGFGRTYLLVDDGIIVSNPYYVYVANGDPLNMHWTFKAVYRSPNELKGTATVQVQMLDKSTRQQQMTLIEQKKQKDGTWLAEFATDMFIEQAGDHIFNTSSVIPTAFDVFYVEEASQMVERPVVISQPEIDGIKLALTPQELYKDRSIALLRSAKDENEKPYISDEDANALAEDTDYTWVIFHTFWEYPELVELYESLPAEQQQQMEAMDAGVAETWEIASQCGAGFTTSPRECNDAGEWMQANTNLKVGQTFDAANLIASGFTLATDSAASAAGAFAKLGTPKADGTVAPPAQIATRVNADSAGRPQSVSYADANGCTMTLQMPKAIQKHDLAKSIESDPQMQTLKDTFDFGSNRAAETGLAADGLKHFLSHNGGNAGLSEKVIKNGLNWSKAVGTGAKIGGAACGMGSAVVKSEELAGAYERAADIQGEIENIDIWYNYYLKHINEVAPSCFEALRQQKRAAQDMLRYASDDITIKLLDTGSTVVYTTAGVLTSGTAAGVVYGASSATSYLLGKWGAENAQEFWLAARRYENATKRRKLYCGETGLSLYQLLVIMDPSGIVYEGVEENTLEGVTATVYQVKDDGKEVIWNAVEFGQQNMQVTEADGVFGWDVPSGKWRVRFTKDGYKTAQTAVLTVPPPKTGLKIAMESTASPVVENMSAYTDYVEIVFSQYMDTSKGCSVSVGGNVVAAADLNWVDVKQSPEGKSLAKALRVPVPAGAKVGDTVKVGVSGATNYAGTAMKKADATSKNVKLVVRPSRIEFNFADTISLQVGQSRPTTVRVYDEQGKPVQGFTLAASLSSDVLAEVSDKGAKTDASGAAKLNVTAKLPGLSRLTVRVEGTNLMRTIDLLTTADTNQTARPTASIGGQKVGEGAPKENDLTVAAGSTLTLACKTEGATIYYTTDGSCPCQNTSARRTYTGPITVTEDTNFIVASYKDGMDYSDKLHLRIHVTSLSFVDVDEKTPHSADIGWLASAGISTGWLLADGTREFRPFANVKRADMAAFLFRLAASWGVVDAGWQPKGASPFSDVDASTPHYREVMWLAESGISKGWTVGGRREFRPSASIVRADMAAFLFRLAEARGVADGAWQPRGASPFRDVDAGTPHYREVMWLAESGVSKGWTVGGAREFRPSAYIVRADMAAFLHRLDGLK